MLGSGCLPCPDPFYEALSPSPEVRLPLDESPHCFGGVEWWYYTGRLTADTGREFGVEAVIFHLPQFPTVVATEVWVAHYSVIDVQAGQFRYDQAASLGPQWCAGTAGMGFDLDVQLVNMRGGKGEDAIRAAFPEGDYALDLTLTDVRGPILHEGTGYVPYGADGSSFYYSRPRMEASGTLCVGEVTLNVSGRMWFDRQWGRDLTNFLQRWNWYSIRLDDGTDIMLFEFPGGDGPVAFGTVVPPSEAAYSISKEEFSAQPTATWISPATGIEYAVGWQVELPARGMVLTLAAVVEDAELDVRATTRNTYWEGLCTVDGVIGDQPAGGYAYVELANGGF